MPDIIEYVPIRVNTSDRDVLKEIKELLTRQTKRPVTLTEAVHNAISMYYKSLMSSVVSDTEVE